LQDEHKNGGKTFLYECGPKDKFVYSAGCRCHTCLVLPQLSSAFFWLFFCFGFFVTENAVIDVTVWEMVTNIAQFIPFRLKKIIQIHAANLEIFKE
jgi:hypothetical protein